MTTTDATPPPPGEDRRDVDEDADAPSVGHRELDLLGAERRRVLQLAGQRKLLERVLPPVGVPPGHDLEELLDREAGGADRLDDPARLAVERGHAAPSRFEDHDADGRGLDEGLEVGPGALDGAVHAPACDRGRGLRGEEHEDRLVVPGERGPVLLVAQQEVAEALAPVVHRRALHRRHVPGIGREAERAQVGGKIGDAKRGRQARQVLEELRAVAPLHQGALPLGRDAGEDEVPGPAPLADRRDHALAAAGQRAGALDGLLERRRDVGALADPEDRRAQAGGAVPRQRPLTRFLVSLAQSPLPGKRRRAGPATGPATRVKNSGLVTQGHAWARDSLLRSR